MTATSGDTIASVVVDRFRAGDGFGLLLTGDPYRAEETFRVLAPDADVAFGHAEAVDAERLAAVGPADRVLALAWDPADVHPALLRRCSAVLRFPGRVETDHAATSASESARPLTLDTVVERTVRLLHAAEIHDHGLDIATARLARGLLEDAGVEPLEVIRSVVVAPRATDRAPTPPEPTDGVDDDATDDETTAAELPETDGAAGSAGAPDDDDPGGPDEDSNESDAHDSSPGDGAEEGPGDQPDGSEDDETPGSGETVLAEGTADAPATHDEPPLPAPDQPDILHADSVSTGSQQHSTADTEHQGDDTDSCGVVDATIDTTMGFTAPPAAGTCPGRALEQSRNRARRRRTAVRHLRGRSGPSSEAPDRGRISRTSPYDSSRGIAVAASLLRAARRAAAETAAGVDTPARLIRDDLRSARRRRRGGVHTVIVVDGSSSLGRDGLLRAGSLTDQLVASATARRGVVSVVVACGERGAAVAIRSTSVHRSRDALRRARTGGGTPLSDGLLTALSLLAEDDRTRRRIIVVTDGRPTVNLAGRGCDVHAAAAELEQVLRQVAEQVPDVAMLPVGVPPGKRFDRDTAAFRAVGAQIL